MTKKYSYLDVYSQRQLLEEIRHSAAFGQILGTAFGRYGWFGYFIGTGHSDGFYLAFCFAGASLLLIGLAYPLWLSKVAGAFRNITGKVGHFIFQALLAVIYAALLTPLGVLVRAKNSFPAAQWDNCPASSGRSWQPKTTHTLVQNNSSKASMWSIFYTALRHFAMHGQWFLIPLVVLLLSLGIVLFFAQTSAIAPFIYTLF